MPAVLTLLRIKNLALVEELEWQIGPGFVAVTGETGAGKSIIIGALQLLLGERADLKKQPAAKARLRLAVAQRG
jgi:DNA repair ATPase RecN